MFGQNEIVGAKYFKDVASDKLLVTSMFFTLQGEGPFRGMPAFFIRLAKCNLACSFCDTYFDSGTWMTFDEIKAKIELTLDEYYWKLSMPRPEWTTCAEGDEEFGLFSTKRRMVLVITGGEPTLQSNLVDFIDEVRNDFYEVQIETNGIRPLPFKQGTTVVVSPKCIEKDGEPVRYMKPHDDVLKIARCLKFVMEAGDSPYASIPQWAHEWSGGWKEIFISPMNIYNRLPKRAKMDRLSNETTLEQRSEIEEVISFWEPGLLNMESNQKNHEHAALYCVKHGFTFNMQLHLFASLP